MESVQVPEAREATGDGSTPLQWDSQVLDVQAVQCFRCGKYRRVPNKHKYEEIREAIFTHPWECRFASEWEAQPVTCEHEDEFDSPEVVFLYDKPGLPAPPAGWERQCMIRPSTFGLFPDRIADVYYCPPTGGPKIKSMKFMEQYQKDNPGSLPAEFDVTKRISFEVPKPPRKMVMRVKRKRIKRVPTPTNQNQEFARSS